MNILWDLRLFSFGYRYRGIGTYCRNLASAILSLEPDFRIFAWGDRSAVPETIGSYPITWISYNKGSWKSSILHIPYLVVYHKIDLLHYWVALGPITSIGISPLPLCPSVATVYDLGIDLWDTPHGRSVRASTYWKTQKKFIASVDGLCAISRSTLQDLTSLDNLHASYRQVVYMPLEKIGKPEIQPAEREPFFISLGGSPHKNCASVVRAYSRIQKRYPDYRLLLLGHIDPDEESLTPLPPGVVLEPSMRRYREYLQKSSGLLFCSHFEGLGIPPLEAMQYGCPLLLSSIRPLLETCKGAGRFVDPCSVEDIEAGMADLINDNDGWAKKSLAGARKYRKLSSEAGQQCINLYNRISGVPVSQLPPPKRYNKKQC